MDHTSSTDQEQRTLGQAAWILFGCGVTGLFAPYTLARGLVAETAVLSTALCIISALCAMSNLRHSRFHLINTTGMLLAAGFILLWLALAYQYAI